MGIHCMKRRTCPLVWTYSSVSDYDIAIFENHLSALDKACLRADVDEIETLKKIDIVFVHENSTDELMESIKREGVIIYE